ncbi:MAG: hypothetical protein Kow0042_25280 [Calditrichia bacterium]
MIKRILIPLDSSPYSDSAIDFGCFMSKITGAHLTGLVTLDLPGIEKSIGPIPIGGIYYAEKLEKSKQAEAEKHIHRLLEKFKKKCEAAGIPHREAEFQGSPSKRIIQESIFYDAVVMGLRTYFNFEEIGHSGDSLENIIDQTITPIYGIPEKLELPPAVQEKIKVLIAFDGSLPAARALQRFTQLARPDIFEVKLLTSSDDKTQADYYLNQAETYLRCHEITTITKEYTSDNIITVLESQFLDWAHLVVVGVHSKKGLLDFMVGSLTRSLIKMGRKPLLIGQ